MAGLIDDLVETMSQENDIYKELIPITREKTRVIINNDLSALQEITDKEQLCVEQITVLERKREEVIKNIGVVLSKDPQTLSMRNLIKIMSKQPEQQERLAKIHDELTATVKTLITLNDRNNTLIQQSLEMIDFNLNLIQSTRMAPGVNNYTRGASEAQVPAARTRMFDAKQ